MTMKEKLNAANLPRALTDDETDTLLEALPRNVLEDLLDPSATGGEDVEHVRQNWRALLPSLSAEFPPAPAVPTVPVPVTLHNSLPVDIVVISAETTAQIATAVSAALSFADITEANVKDADTAWRNVQGLLRAIEIERQNLKRPLLDLGRALDAAAKDAVEPLEAARRALGDRLALFNAEQRRKAEAEAERVRKQKHEAAEREAARVREENAKRAAESAAHGKPPPPPVLPKPPPPPVPVPVPKPVVSSAVTTRTKREVVVIDRNAIPDEVGGVFLWDLNEDAVKKLLTAGAKIPGVDLVEVEVTTGRR